MSDGLTEDTGFTELSLDAAGQAIEGLLSGEPEDEQLSKAPTAAETDAADETDDADDTKPDASDVESDDDDDESVDTAATEPRKLRVKVNGEEQELPEDEVVKGYSRTADYTRKTQELAEQRKAFEAEATAVRAERERYASQLAQLEEVLKQSTPAEPDWDTLRNEDPAVFAATYAAWKQHQESLDKVAAERQRAEQKVRDDYLAEHKAMLAREQEQLLAAVPAWKDPEVAKREQAALITYATSQGYTEDEIRAVTDHRVIKILRDAAAHQSAMKKAPEIEKRIEKAKTLAPGASGTPKREVTELTRHKQALAKTGSLRDAGAAIALLLDE